MQIRETDRRSREWERLQEATGENTVAGALDVAVRYYLEMGATDIGERVGKTSDLMDAAAKRGSLTGPEIAELIDNEYLPVEAKNTYSVGRTD